MAGGRNKMGTECDYLLNKIKELSEENKRLRKVIADYISEVDTRIEKNKELVELMRRALEIKIPPSLLPSIPTSITRDSKQKVSLEEATLIVKEVFAKMKGNEEIQERRYIDCLGFDVINAKEEEEDGKYVIECEVGDSLFNKEKSRYVAEVSNDGELLFLANEYALKGADK